jgi:small subunit ribosomal protein S6
MKNYEITFIVDPVLSGDEIKQTAKTYQDLLKTGGCSIVHTEEMGLRQLAYPIQKRHSGIMFCIEFNSPNGAIIDSFELALRRDGRIIRFLTVALDKFGVKYNDDKRKGLIGNRKEKIVAEIKEEKKSIAKPAPAAKAAPAPAPVAEAPAKKEEE